MPHQLRRHPRTRGRLTRRAVLGLVRKTENWDGADGAPEPVLQARVLTMSLTPVTSKEANLSVSLVVKDLEYDGYAHQ